MSKFLLQKLQFSKRKSFHIEKRKLIKLINHYIWYIYDIFFWLEKIYFLNIYLNPNSIIDILQNSINHTMNIKKKKKQRCSKIHDPQSCRHSFQKEGEGIKENADSSNWNIYLQRLWIYAYCENSKKKKRNT